MPAERFESEFVELMTDLSSGEKAAVIASVDIVEVEVRSRFLGLATYLRVVTESQEGVRLEFDFKAGKGWFGGVGKKYFYERWLQEFTALTMPIIDDALGGEAFWDRVYQELKERGLTVVPASDEITLGVLVDPGNPPRVLDGPDETLEAIEDLARQGLEKAGFRQTEAMAKLYLYHNPTTVTMGDFVPRFAWWEAMKDQKLAAALRENSAMRLEYRLSYVDMLERCARGEPLGRVNRLRSGPFY
jgi:hypothetical protein